MKEVGGFISPQNQKKICSHENMVSLNTARNAIEYVLLIEKPSAVWLPKWCCNALLEPMEKLRIPIKWYSVDQKFEPLNISPCKTDVLIIINYYGMVDYDSQCNLKAKYKETTIIFDNSQSFHTKPLAGCYSIYSCRKFFPVTDGAFLYTEKYLDDVFNRDISYERIGFLYKRLELGANQAYKDFLNNEDVLSNQDILLMSRTTQSLLSCLDIVKISRLRQKNFGILHKELKEINQFVFQLPLEFPLCYPFFLPSNGKELKNFLITNHIFIPTYWNDSLMRLNKNENEINYVNNIIPLPLDQRYDSEDMMYLIHILKEGLNKICKK